MPNDECRLCKGHFPGRKALRDGVCTACRKALEKRPPAPPPPEPPAAAAAEEG